MAHSIVKVAKVAGVTSRTLRHYDEIGFDRKIKLPRSDYITRG